MKATILPLLLLLILGACSGESDTTTAQRPNVLILFTDDQRYNTVHALGNEEIQTPNLDRLAQRGVAFTRAHTMGGHHGALCAPSRAMLMTGRSLFNLHESGDLIPEEHVMMPELFARAGYRTFGTGKWHNNKSAYARAFQDGGNIFFGGMHWPRDGGHEAPWLHHFDPDSAYPKEARWQGDDYSSTLFANAAIDFLNRQKESDQPFFAYVSFSSPHDPRTPPPPYDSLYTSENITLPPNFLPEHPFDNGELVVRDEKLQPWPRTPEIIRQDLAAYYGMISEVDAEIGRILDALEATGKLDNTLVVFAGDNGLAMGSHGLLGKQSLYDHSMRVPLILAGPTIPQGETRDALTYLFDLFPTLVDLIDLDLPATVQGQNLVPVLEQEDTALRDNVFLAYRDLQRAVRTNDDWKLIKYDVKGESHTQFFNLNDDPHEMNNLADDPAHASRLADLERLLVLQSQAYADQVDLTAPNWGKAPPEKRAVVDHLAKDKAVQLAEAFSPNYPGKGPAGLTDGIRCTSDHTEDCWQAYEQSDLEATIDLGAPQDIQELATTFLRKIGAWIFLPTEVEYALSMDGETYEVVGTLTNPAATENDPSGMEEMLLAFKPRDARYIRVRAKNQGVCPAWHNGAGGKAWLFVDEIRVN